MESALLRPWGAGRGGPAKDVQAEDPGARAGRSIWEFKYSGPTLDLDASSCVRLGQSL